MISQKRDREAFHELWDRPFPAFVGHLVGNEPNGVEIRQGLLWVFVSISKGAVRI